jgi:hypothetical protein
MKFSTLCADCALHPERIQVVISVRGRVNPRVIVPLEGLGKFEISIDLIRNRNRDIPVCSIVSQLTKLPRAPHPIYTVQFQISCVRIPLSIASSRHCWKIHVMGFSVTKVFSPQIFLHIVFVTALSSNPIFWAKHLAEENTGVCMAMWIMVAGVVDTA